MPLCVCSFNLVSEAEVKDIIVEQKGLIRVSNGELFMRLPLTENLTEDTSSGKLILTSVRSVLLALNNSDKRRVYEAVILREDNFNYEGRGKDYVYVCLSPVCVKELKLKAGTTVEVSICLSYIPGWEFLEFKIFLIHFCFSEIYKITSFFKIPI